MPRTNRHARRAFTLVEVIAATAIMATLTAASFALVRTANNAWLRHRNDSNQRREATMALQHVMRRVRQAKRVTVISTAADASGALTLLLSNGTTAVWDHVAGTNQLLYGTSTPTNILGTGITAFTVTPSPFTSAARDSVQRTSALFDIEYAALLRAPLSAPTAETLTMRP